MSLKAITWVMESAPVESPAEMVILYALADRAHDDGTSAWPSHQWIADRAVCSRRTVIRHIKAMEKRGLIRRGDQRFVQHLPADKRPVVWDLDLSLTRPQKAHATRQSDTSTGCQSVTPDRSGVTNGAQRGDTSCNSDVTTRAQRGDTGVTQSVLEPSLEPPMNQQPPVVPQGGPDEPNAEIATIDDTTPATTEPGAPGRKRGSRLPEGFMPSGETIQSVRSTFPGIESEFMSYEHEKFLDYWMSVSGARGTKLDWDATWRNWMKRAVENLRPAERQAMFGLAPAMRPAQPSKQQQARDLAAQLSAEGAFAGRRLRS